MLDLRTQAFVWPEDLRPVGEGDIEKEPFALWWGRHADRLANLHPQIAEQWVHRHWQHTRFGYVPLESLQWSFESWSNDRIFSDVHREFAATLNPEFDYKAFHGHWPHPTARALDQGTWDFPIVVLRTPHGVHSFDGPMPNVRFVLVEGHQRTRYLNALLSIEAHRNVAPGPHKLFLLDSPLAGLNPYFRAEVTGW